MKFVVDEQHTRTDTTSTTSTEETYRHARTYQLASRSEWSLRQTSCIINAFSCAIVWKIPPMEERQRVVSASGVS